MIKKIIHLISKEELLPLWAGLASGLYPIAFYYSKNFNFVNSWSHLLFFVLVFLCLPIAVNYIFYFFYKKKHLNSYKYFVLPTLNALAFFSMAIIAMESQMTNKMFAVALVLTFIVAFACLIFYKKALFPKIMVLQLVLFVISMYTVSIVVWGYLRRSDTWISSPDHIDSIIFKKRPNIYVLQPDGYVNPSELKKGYYQYDNSEFETKLSDLGFKVYQDFRSNYPSTTSSNSSMFAMKHHYFNQKDERNTILNLNPVVKILKNNNYTTHFFAEIPYLMANRPKISFDYTNIQLKDVAFLGRGFGERRDMIAEVKPLLASQQGSNFYFFERLIPGHINTYPDKSKTFEIQRNKYLSDLQKANLWLEELITLIQSHDPEGIIIIIADHGGYVGWEYSLQSFIKTQDRDLLYSAYSALLAIYWAGEAPESDQYLKTSVNLFRILFSHLAEDLSLLDHLQEDTSVNRLREGEPTGVYKMIGSDGTIIFEEP